MVQDNYGVLVLNKRKKSTQFNWLSKVYLILLLILYLFLSHTHWHYHNLTLMSPGVCEVGQFGDTTSCNDCAVGSYQPLPGQPQCTTCQSGYSTLTNGSSLVTQCLSKYTKQPENGASKSNSFHQNLAVYFRLLTKIFLTIDCVG